MKARVPWIPSKREEKVMLEEINRQLRIAEERRFDDVVAMFLWGVHVVYGSKKRKLREVYDVFDQIHQDLMDYYDMPGEAPWLCHQKLKELGVDIKKWRGEQS